MKIYILTTDGEITTDNSELSSLLNKINLATTDEEKNLIVQSYDAKIVELFGQGSRHLGSEQ